MSLREVDWQIAYSPNDDPLHRFYIPALQRSVRYDRSAGFFSSTALAIAAAGVAGLIQNGGVMRLLVGAQLSEQDVEAIKRGQTLRDVVQEKLLAALQQPEDEVMRRRWEILAWMVAQGTLEMKVVLETDAHGFPVVSSGYFHVKEGILTDAEGNQLAFSGSINESLTAWQRNYERFYVFRSWEEGTRGHVYSAQKTFDMLWNNQDDNWLAIDIPEAARESLLRYTPAHAPEYDPLDRRSKEIAYARSKAAILQRERILFSFLRDAPTLPNSHQLGLVTSAIRPWPHQVRVLQRVLENYPRGMMLCDEVGLGKTIEAGLILRQLLISRMVRRALLLVPKSVARQWQEELYEKFALDVPLYHGGQFTNYAGETLSPQRADANPWNRFDVMIASSQLAKRKERHEELVQAMPWDLIMVDEAHHARRKDFKERIYRPNRLLSLLVDPRLKASSVILMTATPMQVHPLEVWDLLKVLGMGGKWGADDDYFLYFYEQLRVSNPDEVEWKFVFDMVCDFLEYSGERNEAFEREGQAKLGPVTWTKVRELPCSSDPAPVVRSLPPEAKAYARRLAREYTPLRSLMIRNTRDLLREYVRQGILLQRVPTRRPQNIWIPMRPEEQNLYDRIEDYISNFYNKYEARRKGLGFIMTIYRRRLTSSFHAVRKSLERRYEFLRGNKHAQLITDEDAEDDDLAGDVLDEQPDETQADLYREEIAYVEDFLHELTSLSTHDSKVEQLLSDLSVLFRTYRSVIVFTQYTDTMDYLRDKLREVYGDRVACYSGRGGEVWNSIAGVWTPVPKETIKHDFRDGEAIQILLCTEAASEGLNLQTCGVLINHDMPWNPMRVEQRIGRIDRIGQVHEEVQIRNYFYKDTIEARVYQALAHRIGWFETVVGGLQPILTEVNRTIQELAMTSRDERESAFEERVARLEHQLQTHEDGDILNVYDSHADVQPVPQLTSPVSLTDLEHVFCTSRQYGKQLAHHDSIADAYYLQLDDGKQQAVTFAPHVFDAHPVSVTLLSYGNPLLQRLFDHIPQPSTTERQGLLRLSIAQPFPRTAYYTLRDGEPVLIENVKQLNQLLETNGNVHWAAEAEARAKEWFSKLVFSELQKFGEQAKRLNVGAQASLAERARRLLNRAALIEIVQSHVIPGMESSDAAVFNEQAVLGLKRHGYPFTHLLAFLNDQVSRPISTDPDYADLVNASAESLRKQWLEVKKQAETLIQQVYIIQANVPPEIKADIESTYYSLS